MRYNHTPQVEVKEAGNFIENKKKEKKVEIFIILGIKPKFAVNLLPRNNKRNNILEEQKDFEGKKKKTIENKANPPPNSRYSES